MAKRISSGEPKPRRTPARRRTEKPAPSPVQPVESAPAAEPEPVRDVVMTAAPAPAAPAGGALAARVAEVASAVWSREGAKPDPQAVARRAFELFLARGGVHGHDVEDWLAAERELRRR